VPKKPSFSKEFIEKWKPVLIEIQTYDDIPIEYIEHLVLFFKDGRKPAFIDINAMLQKEKTWKVEKIISAQLEEIDSILERVEFHLNIPKIVEVIEHATEDTLKKL